MLRYVIIFLLQTLCTTRGEATNFSLTTVPAIPERFSMDVKQEVCLKSHCNESLLMCSESDSCPPGLFCEEGTCQCADYYPHNIISCNGTSSSVLSGYCATWDRDRNITLTGACIYNNHRIKDIYYYRAVSPNVNELNDMMCKSLNRTGALCGKCLPHHFPLAYYFNLTCIPCPHVGWNWFRYIMAAYLPLTLFYLVIFFFKINITSSHLLPAVVYCQLLSSGAAMIDIVNTDLFFITIVKIIFSLYGIWNLDFFRPFYSDICLGMGTLPTLALDYAIALYPLLLVIITYLLIVLYDRNYRVITVMWRPFRVLFSYYRRDWDVRTSVINAYATFFLLSFTKFLSVSFNLFVPTRVYELHQHNYTYSLGLFLAADIEYFGSEHLPYGILAIIMCLFFVILPVTTLFLYPFTFFQRFLNLFPGRWLIFIRTFMDAFQGCYKDGTEPGTRDCRWFSSVYFLSHFWLFVLNSFIPNTVSFIIVTIVLFNLSLFIMLVQPFKSSLARYNLLAAVFILLFVLFLLIPMGIPLSNLYMKQLTYFFIVLILFIYSAALFYVSFCVSYWIFKNSCKIFIRKIKYQRNGYENLSESSEERIMDRIENPGAYPRGNLAKFNLPEM